MSMKTLYLNRIAATAFVAAVLAGCGLFRPSAPVFEPEAVLDHYLCYFFPEANFNPPAGVTIKDQFGGPRPAAFVLRDFLCNPVEKTKSDSIAPIRHPGAHLFCYRLINTPVEAEVRISNQFDSRWHWPWLPAGQKLKVVEDWAVCLPAGKAPASGRNPPPIPNDVDHFTCYRVIPEDTVSEHLTLADQFLKGPSRAWQAFLLCNPTEKRHGTQHDAPKNPKAHLVCYFVDTPSFPVRPVQVNDQFEHVPVITPRLHPPYLCVPSTKEVLTEPHIPPPPKEVQGRIEWDQARYSHG